METDVSGLMGRPNVPEDIKVRNKHGLAHEIIEPFFEGAARLPLACRPCLSWLNGVVSRSSGRDR